MKTFQPKTTLFITFLFFIVTGVCQNKKTEKMNTATVKEFDDNYQWALIGSTSDKYLWILNRTPKLDESVKNLIPDKARTRGYNISKLIWVEQKS